MKKRREGKREGILFLASQKRLASGTKTGSRLLVVTESNFMLKFSSFLNVFLRIGEKNPANIYFYIPKIATPKGARDTDTVNKEVEYSSI